MKWLRVGEAAVQLDVTPGRVYQLIADGRLEHALRDGYYYVNQRSVRRYIRYQIQLHRLRTTGAPL